LGNRVEVITFGCRLNSYESDVLRGIVEEAARMNVFARDGVVIFNSCAVTAEAERQLRQSIRKIRREKGKNVTIGVVGCAAQINRSSYRNMPEVDFVLGNADKFKIESYLHYKNQPTTDPNTADSCRFLPLYPVDKFTGMSRASVKIQDGCNNECTFCATRFARGRSISSLPTDIVEQVKKLVDLGFGEIVLTGVNICDYGKGLDVKVNLGDLVGLIVRETSLERLRLSSLDIAAIGPTLMEQIKYERRLMPHLHLSLQSGDDVILRKMGRRHSEEDVFNICRDILSARPEVVFGADFIAGFPTETDEMHNNSLRMLWEIPITYGHIFPYNPRPGTRAASMVQIPKNIKTARAKQLREAAAANLLKLRNVFSGTRQMVFVETANSGRLENYLKVSLDGNYGEELGKIVMATVL
jgi:threonylcarbamoyladenosine tRNA methylthiotransferase MtaB